jgi:hypothetical protein
MVGKTIGRRWRTTPGRAIQRGDGATVAVTIGEDAAQAAADRRRLIPPLGGSADPDPCAAGGPSGYDRALTRLIQSGVIPEAISRLGLPAT